MFSFPPFPVRRLSAGPGILLLDELAFKLVTSIQIVISVGGEAHVPAEARPHPVLHLVRRPQLPSVVQEELLLLLPLRTGRPL